jgi:hypothetical protein
MTRVRVYWIRLDQNMAPVDMKMNLWVSEKQDILKNVNFTISTVFVEQVTWYRSRPDLFCQVL